MRSLGDNNATMFFGVLLSALWGAMIAVYRLYAEFTKPAAVPPTKTDYRYFGILCGALVGCLWLAKIMYHCLVYKPARAEAAAARRKYGSKPRKSE